MIIFTSLQNFMSLHCKSLMPSKSMPNRVIMILMKIQNIFMLLWVHSIELMGMKDILIRNNFFAVGQRFRIRVRHIMTKKLAKR